MFSLPKSFDNLRSRYREVCVVAGRYNIMSCEKAIFEGVMIGDTYIYLLRTHNHHRDTF